LLKQFGDGLPSFDYPVNRLTDRLANGLELFEDKDATILALEAVGDPQNHLRFVAANAVLSLDYMSPEEEQEFDWQSWWDVHKEAFTICHDVDSARRIAEKYLDSDDGIVSSGASATLGKVREAQAQDE